jgi:hypothetical protein
VLAELLQVRSKVRALDVAAFPREGVSDLSDSPFCKAMTMLLLRAPVSVNDRSVAVSQALRLSHD